MSDKKPVCTCAGVTTIINCSVTETHNATTSTAVIEAESTTKSLGDAITVYMGYSDGTTDYVFTGYVKQVERKTPDSTVVITASDKLIRAVDYFIAPTNPEATYKRSKVQAEVLVGDLLGMAGLSLYDTTSSYFTLANEGELEVNLVTVYDYCKTIADLITWSVWADRDGRVHFRNRKPYTMLGDTGQVDDRVDSPIAYTWDDVNVLNISYTFDEKDLRNRIVVYGSDASAEASASSPYLPSNFYKTAVVGAQLMVSGESNCQQIADYNLDLYNKPTEKVSCQLVGNPILQARKTITMNSSFMSGSINKDWYIFSCEHSFSNSGYVCNLDLRV